MAVNPTPALGVVPSGRHLLIFRPATAPGFVMETSPSRSPVQWVPVSGQPFVIGDEYLEFIQTTGTIRFYRMRLSGPRQ